ncbi:MAG: Eco57I restriction-modification methylase domain-containing protein [Chloroflexi bacterium]|nr:Eco57I restriction-modification methylase domain-containing protein [Chloroflexota bacterium]
MLRNHSGRQISFPGIDAVQEAVERLSVSGIEKRGAIFTRREVVDFILDLVGYSPDMPLYERKILEPSFGEGDFLVPIVERLLDAYGRRPAPQRGVVEILGDCIRAVELNDEALRATRERLEGIMSDAGLAMLEVDTLLNQWLVQGDFLLEDLPFSFEYVVGNPPYVRQELIPDILIQEYRRRFTTIYDRADLYIPFIEKSLLLLAPAGVLGFICADRWTKNRYGARLRNLVAKRFHLKYYVDMTDTPAFLSEVSAYPAVIVISSEAPGPTRLAHRPAIEASVLTGLVKALQGSHQDASVMEVRGVAADSNPWVLESFECLKLVQRLEAEFPLIEQTGCKVGIGVATGADAVFISSFDDMDVEDDRKLLLARTKDIADGTVQWQGYGVINPFDEEGSPVDLGRYPRLARYFKKHEQALRARHVAKHNPLAWYRTIDRIYPELATKPKLLIPDIKGAAQVVYEEGRLYPHHNLYYITSEVWDLRTLQAVLMSGIAQLFVSMYSTKMRGGYLRYQAQYLRRIRLPRWQDIPDSLRTELTSAAQRQDVAACNSATFELYNLSSEERTVVEENGGYSI